MGEGAQFLCLFEDLMDRKTALHWWECSVPLGGSGRRRDRPHDSPRSGGEPTAGPSLGAPIGVLLSLGLWARIWSAFSLFVACALQ